MIWTFAQWRKLMRRKKPISNIKNIKRGQPLKKLSILSMKKLSDRLKKFKV